MGEIRIEYYTDPLCSWSWALEPHWRRLREELSGRLSVRYRMGGMLPDWNSYEDPLNSIHRPAQMAPQWFHIQQVTGVPVDEQIWLEDPPGSSYPACVAFKAAERQAPELAETYLERLRRAVMTQRRNIARREVLLEVAGEAGVDRAAFEAALDADETLDAFREDLKEARYRGIGRFPTLVIESGERGVVLVGYRPYEVLREAVDRLTEGATAPPTAASSY